MESSGDLPRPSACLGSRFPSYTLYFHTESRVRRGTKYIPGNDRSRILSILPNEAPQFDTHWQGCIYGVHDIGIGFGAPDLGVFVILLG